MYLFGLGLDPRHPEFQLVYCKWMLSISYPSILSSEKSSFHPEDKDLTMKQLLQWSPPKSMSEQWSIVRLQVVVNSKIGGERRRRRLLP